MDEPASLAIVALPLVDAAEIDFAHGDAGCEHLFGMVRSISTGRHHLDPLPLRGRLRRTMDAPGAAVPRAGRVVRCGWRARRIARPAGWEAMRFELLSIIGAMVAVGITLGAVVIGRIVDLRAEMQTLRTEVRTDIADVRTDIRALETRLAGVERRQAHTEGLLEELRDAITARRDEDPPVRKEST